MDPFIRKEHEKWTELCAHLKTIGAVTDADLKARANAPATTPGQQLFKLIREWGALNVKIHQEG